MASPVIELSPVDLAVAAALVLVAGVVSFSLRLGLERRLAIGAVRAVVQLLLVGVVLKFVFGLDSAAAVLGLLLFMAVAASVAAVRRPARRYRGGLWRAFLTLSVTGLLTTFTVTGLIVGVEPWYRPQYVIPLLGMILGNGLTGVSLCLDQLLETLDERRHEIEMELAHGATRWEAARDALRAAVRRGMIPVVNSMMVVGVVSLPGMMTGQILAGADPLGAVKYQIVVMFMLAAATALGCVFIALLTYRRLFNARHQLAIALIREQQE
ncbi:MAG: iron export ABC transporter permease subunit FetB [Candidatus Hydrogenedentes bacterium]|nr:iron export ABC transporter permease subunit FetB [Candidatus Hydrogenedentota bacterium]